jgi:putative DNA-invertase from lambdoid prophage Rac
MNLRLFLRHIKGGKQGHRAFSFSISIPAACANLFVSAPRLPYVSTFDQTPENQIREIETAGFAIEPHRIVTETISGSMAIAQREGFSRLLDKMEKGDVLIVTKLDRLGRDAIDVSTTVAKLEEIGIRVHCLALGGVDLTSSAGKMTMNVINAVAQFERDLLIERTQSGLARAKASGKPLGRPSALSVDQQAEVREKLQNGETISAIARQFETSRQTIIRVRDHT